MAFTTVPAAGAKWRGSTASSLFSERTPLFAQMAADQNLTQSNTTMQNLTDLVVTLVANTTYEMSAWWSYNAGATADIKFAITFPTGCTANFWSIGLISTATTDLELAPTIVVPYTSGTERAYGGRGTGSTRALMAHMVIAVGSTAGNFQVQAAQNTSTAETEVVKAGSYITLRKVA